MLRGPLCKNFATHQWVADQWLGTAVLNWSWWP